MAQTITTSVRDLVDAANREIETITAEQAIKLYGRDDVLFVDIRDIRTLYRVGRVPNALHCPRDVLEFSIDPASPHHRTAFAADKLFIFFCAHGYRSPLAALTASRMGLKPVAHLEGGFNSWKKSGGAVVYLQRATIQTRYSALFSDCALSGKVDAKFLPTMKALTH